MLYRAEILHEVCPHLVLDACKIMIACLKRLLFYNSKVGIFLFRLVLTKKKFVKEHRIVLMLDIKLFSEF